MINRFIPTWWTTRVYDKEKNQQIYEYYGSLTEAILFMADEIETQRYIGAHDTNSTVSAYFEPKGDLEGSAMIANFPPCKH